MSPPIPTASLVTLLATGLLLVTGLPLAGCRSHPDPPRERDEAHLAHGHYHGPHFHAHQYEQHHFHDHWEHRSSETSVEVEPDPETETEVNDPPAPPLTPPGATPEPLLPGL